MGTTAQNFYATTTAHDTTYGTTIDKLAETNPAVNSTTAADFGSSGAKNIVMQPFVLNATNTTPMTNAALDPYGWAVNQSGADGMASTASAKRRLLSGTWSFQGMLVAGVASLNNVVAKVRVYRVAANGGSRTQLGSDGSSAGALVSVSGTAWSATIADIGEVILEADETIQVSYYLNGTGQVGGLTIAFQTGNSSTPFQVQVVTPGVRTRSLTTLAAGTLSASGALQKRTGKTLAGTLTMAGAIVQRSIVHQLTSTLSFVGAAVTRRIARTLPGSTLSFSGTVTKKTSRSLVGALSFLGVRTDSSVAISGTTKDEAGAVVGSALVKLFRTATDAKVTETTSDASGNYLFRIASALTHYLVATKAGATPIAGTTRDDITGS